MLIRPIEEKDNAYMEGLIKKLLQDHGLDIPGTAYFDESLKDLAGHYGGQENIAYYVIEIGGKTVGGAGFGAYDWAKGIGELEKLYIDPAYQGRGLATILYGHVEAEARKLGYRQIYIETSDLLAKANLIYEKWGFKSLDGPLRPGIHHAMNRFFIKDI